MFRFHNINSSQIKSTAAPEFTWKTRFTLYTTSYNHSTFPLLQTVKNHRIPAPGCQSKHGWYIHKVFTIHSVVYTQSNMPHVCTGENKVQQIPFELCNTSPDWSMALGSSQSADWNCSTNITHLSSASCWVFRGKMKGIPSQLGHSIKDQTNRGLCS